MKLNKLVTNKERNHRWCFSVLDPFTIHLTETVTIKNRAFFPDLSNELWVFALLKVEHQQVFFKVGHQRLSVSPGTYILFKPPFGLTEIGSRNTTLTFKAILSKHALPHGTPELPTLFQYPRNELPPNYETLFQHLEAISNPTTISRYRADQVSAIANKLKKLLERHYNQPLPLAEIAKRCGISPSLMSMYFKKHFHMTPSTYRKQLRIKSSVFQLLESASTKKKISDIAFDCGYSDLSRYNKQFKSFTGVTPNQVKT